MNVKQVSKVIGFIALLVIVSIGILATFAAIHANGTKALTTESPAIVSTVSTSYQAGTYHRVESGTVSKFAAKVRTVMPACHNTVHPTALKNNGFGHPACLPNGETVSIVREIKKSSGTNDTPTLEVSDPIYTPPSSDTPSNDTPAVNPSPVPNDDTPSPDDNKKHCNNGEGRGGEGCSPAQSDNANNDENQTTPREDNANRRSN